ncbi:hypothetical protein [Corynebacterium heidelbergense]|uniref:Serine hydrolase n=1 Tax=Corynebacterium heidelbergense TaxID=2055947 RepID=A0A364VAS8_9CORY|nr:hypothetical protein [Corynebacterium heidelbergense]RAV33724.1 hypothetical protein CWC39_06975 [Corynebacterium heidelbergense]WCZ35799.1 hypothetical protein CHEID_01105 [Corynebacterium heidelbergense]
MGKHRLEKRRLHTFPRRRTAVATAAAAAAATMLGAPLADAAPTPITQNGMIPAPPRTQISFQNSVTGFHAGTANENESRPGLSIVKMYIADYVFAHGTPEDQAQATQMLRFSDDRIASQLYAKYPNSINDTAGAYGLNRTHGAAHWGNSTTSTADSVRYLEAKKHQNPSDPVLLALASASPVAADGYRQDYGTATLPGVLGTKFGWSDDRSSINATASYGSDFSVAASTYGNAQQLTNDVQTAFAPAPGSAVPGLAPGLAPGMVDYPARQAAANALGSIPGSSASQPAAQPLLDAIPQSVPVPAPLRPLLP